MRGRLRTFLIVVAALVLLFAAWLWWNRPQPVDMATYAPADALAYLEANSLPEVFGGLTSTDAWQALAPAAGLKSNYGQLSWLSRAAAWTGIGQAEAVVLSRAQLAVVVMGLDAAEEPEQALHIKPRVALVFEAHTSKRRTQAAFEKLLGDYARRAHGTTQPERKESGDATLVTWSNPRGGLPIVAAFLDTVAIVGNDEASVQACLAVRRGEHAPLANDPQLATMRERLNADDALAFGYVPPAGARRLLTFATLAYAGRLATDQKAQSAAAILLPQLTERLVGGAAWSARIADGTVTDTYLLNVPSGVPARLRDALTAAEQPAPGAAALVPADVYQLTRYNYARPEMAWRELQALLSSQLDVTIAPFVARFLDEALKPFGIADPREFLRAAGPELITMRLDETGERLLLVAQVRDAEALRAQVRKQIGGARVERTQDAELWPGADEERGAAAFVDNYLIMGGLEDVRRCLAARTSGRTLATSDAFTRAGKFISTDDPAGVVTLTDEREATRTFITLIARQRALRGNTQPDEVALKRALDAHEFAVSETRPVEGGFERRTRSAFGLFGMIAAQLGAEAGR